ncbi:hypothetical protein LMG28688_03583 [Paraburkholderia caffeinitolerans]|uniref:Uncharacterized protein n=1 Tax=Paraburkholderia caffeinitolerans TaxID=1723730 RepID=A0A6J5G4F8_9BURK|nr:hypothetical protein [Paraburkholderia caffeinitolerans]CAB3792662.1 hypothetical protein LMG28688_03583 [Paraburkholderia caffeinitolerans]
MSVPDNSRSKASPSARPSLLADNAAKAASAPANGAANGSRILANLEGRVVPPAAPAGKASRSSKPAALVALLVIGAGAFGAWHLMTRAPSTAASVAAPASATLAVAAASASQAVVASAQTSAPDAGSASQAAKIVSDDDAANARPASDADRLSRALAGGVGNASSATVAAATPKAAQAQAPHAQAQSREKGAAKQQTASAHRAESKGTVAPSKKPGNAAKKDDSDVDLLAVLVARTKPADTKTAARGSKAKASADNTASLAQQVKACGERGFFEDQLCRWRVCDGHWGQDPACPSAARASNEH